MTNSGRHRLAVDLGTSTTIAMMQWPDGRVRPLLFDGSPLLSSAVLFGVDGQLHTGRDAGHLARGNPDRLEPNPKRRIDDDVVLLGPSEVPVGDLLSAVFGRVAEEARRVAGQIGGLILTHPAAWGSRRRAQLRDAAERAGLGRGRLVPEPVAAATYFAHTMIDEFVPGSRLVVYDLGAGTCDITVLRRSPQGFDVVASGGLNDLGGLDVDAAIVGFLEATYGRLWVDAVTRRQVWEDVRNAKEMLSRRSGTVIALPTLGKEAPLGREQFDGLTAPVLRPTISLARSLIRDTHGAAAPGTPTAVVLVGGASRIPLVATLLAEATGVAPIVIEQPELVVAEGALHLAPVADPVTAPADVPGDPAAVPDSPSIDAASVEDVGPATPVPVSGGGPAVPASGISGPVTGAPAGEFDESTSAPGDPPAPVTMPAARGRTPVDSRAPVDSFAAVDGRAAVDGPTPERSRRSRVVVAAIVVAVLLLGGVTAIAMLNRKSAGGDRGATGQPTTGASLPADGESAAAPSGTPAPGKYAMAVLPEKLCTTVVLGRLSATYNSYANTPTDTRAENDSASNASCTMLKSSEANDTLDIRVTAVVFADTARAVSEQKMLFDAAKSADPNVQVLSGIGDESFAARKTATTSTPGEFTYTAEARDGNLRLSVRGTVLKANRQLPSEEQMRQFGRDLGEAARSTIAKFESG